MAELRREYGAALSEADIASLAKLCGGIHAVALQDIWNHSVNLAASSEGDDWMNRLYDSYLHGEITLEKLTAQLVPRLQLYLDE